jgi:hypothetical protein
MRPLRRPLALLAVALAAPALTACGENEETKVGELPGVYLDIGNPEPLKYQVQISRQLDPNSASDAAYLKGIPAEAQGLEADETWFGVFLRVENTESEEPIPSAESFEIHDTQENVFEPVALGAENAFAYEARPISGNETIPTENSPAGQSDINGALLLFKLDIDALQNNRPLELIIESPKVPQDEGRAVLDV